MTPGVDGLQARAEVLKLARMLERDPDQLAYLERLPPEDVRLLRDRVTEVLWNAHGATLHRLAAASRLLPAAVSAAISERAFGPVLTALMAGVLEPSRAVDVAGKLSTSFLADVAVELDPRRSSAVIGQMSPVRIAEITRELVQRDEYVTMGRFVGHLDDDALVGAVAEMDDPALLRVAFVLEEPQRLGHLFALLPEGRLTGILDAAAEHELWEELLAVAEQDDALQGMLAQRLPSLSVGQRRVMARHAREADALERLGPLGRALARQR